MAANERSTFTEADGHQLAIDLLDEMSEIGMDELCIDQADEYREGRSQNDVLTRYLRAAQQHPAVERGFLAVLTDVIGSNVECSGGADYERFVKQLHAETETRRELQRIATETRHGA